MRPTIYIRPTDSTEHKEDYRHYFVARALGSVSVIIVCTPVRFYC